MEAIGHQLRDARETKAISLEMAEDETHIRRKYLQALEAGDESEIPGGDVYLKGFIRTYGNYLGLDGPSLVEAYKQSKGQQVADQTRASHLESAREARLGQRQSTGSRVIATPAAAPLTEPKPARPKAERPTTRSIDRRALRPSRGTVARRRALVTLLVLALVGGGGYAYWRYGPAARGDKGKNLPAPQQQETDAGSQQGAPNSGQQQGQPPQTQPPATQPPATQPEPPKVTMSALQGETVTFTVPAKEITVRLEFGSQPIWYLAAVDETERFQGYPKQPTAEYTGGHIRLRMGHMMDISLVVNGQRFEKPLGKGPYTLMFKPQ